jgi:hypothetical protein
VELGGLATLQIMNFVYFRARKMAQFTAMLFVAGTAVMLVTMLKVDAASTVDCIKDTHRVSVIQ